ncbi:MAG: alkaline phosphatase family protein [Chloroflexi bacterium]|nr:alkaline phosphatase family protein [Chloroflexota bacterium]
MTWLTRKIVDLFNALANLYYSRKYAAIAERMGLEEGQVNAQERGFIILQIDGLAHDHLLEAMAKGHTPYMKRLLDKKALKLARWRCGLPSTTPAAQAGIMFGNNFDIPAFRWYEKESDTSVVCKLPGLVKAMQDRVSAGRQGILRGGSSYVTMFDGDARLSLFTLSAINSQHLFENVRGAGFLLLFLLSPLRMLRVILLSTWEYVVDLGKRFVALFVPGYHQPFSVLSPFLQIITNVVFREIQTFACLIDIYRGMPAIYTNYYSYDEVAHHFGLGSAEALKALRGIDNQIKQIDRMRTQYRKRHYDLYILADHGLTPSIPFKKAYGRTLGQYITEQIAEGVFTDERGGEERPSAAKALFLLEELRGIEARLSERGASLVQAAYRFVDKRLVVDDEDDSWDLSKRGDIVVRNSGSMSHIYFNVAPRPMNLSEIALIYPRLLNKLIEHQGIGLVVGREEGEVVIVGKDGTLTLPPHPPQIGGARGGEEVRGQNPLLFLPEPELAASQLRQLASFPHSGDIIIFGAWCGDGEVICFEDQVASHGGLGGPQDYPFIMYPGELDLDLEEVTNAKDLYPHFAAYL